MASRDLRAASGAPDGAPSPSTPELSDAEVSWDAATCGVTLWGVYGPDCFPSVFACRLRDYFWHSRAVWGFSVYDGKPGFRTLGVGKEWAGEGGLRLFRSRDAAFAHIASLFSEAADAGGEKTGRDPSSTPDVSDEVPGSTS